MWLLIAISTTFVRIVIPTVSAVGGAIGGMVGAFIALAKLMPERAGIIITYQAQIVDDLQSENKRQAELIAHLELRVTALEDAPPRFLS